MYSLVFNALLLLIILTVVAVFIRKAIRNQTMNEQIAKSGIPLGLKVTHPKGKSPLFSLAGTYDGISLTIYETTRRSALLDTRCFWTIYEIPLDSKHIPQNLSMLRKSNDPNHNQLAEHNTMLLNNELDKMFKIQGSSSKDLKDFFERPELKKHLLELAALSATLRLENNTLYFESHRRIIDEGPDLQDRILALTRCAHAINTTTYLEDTEIQW